MRENKARKTNMTESTREQNGNSAIYNLLPVGKENAISTSDLLALTGFKHKREMTKAIEAERRSNALICSSTFGGYYIAKDRIELSEYYNSMKNRAVNIFQVIKHTGRVLRQTEGQEELNIKEEA